MKTSLEFARHIANRGSKALLDIELLGYKADVILKSDFTPADKKVEMLLEINKEILTKVMEGTSSLYSVKNNS